VKYYLDTDALSKLIQGFSETGSAQLPAGVKLVTSDLAIEELIVTSDSVRRLQLAQGIMSLHESGAFVLAHMNHQIDWGIEEFLADAKDFTPFELYNREGVLGLLRRASSLPPALREVIAGKREAEKANWSSMHQRERPRLQKVLESGASVPNAHDWVAMIGSSEFASDLLLDILSSCQREALQGREQEYIKWNPICRCYIEQFLLAIRRHGIEPPNASSKKGPKWADYFHGAFVGVADFFVTDDKRLRRALCEHREVRPDARWMVIGLSEFLRTIESGAEGASEEERVGNEAARWRVPLAAKKHHH
jgi:hypothetical protein